MEKEDKLSTVDFGKAAREIQATCDRLAPLFKMRDALREAARVKQAIIDQRKIYGEEKEEYEKQIASFVAEIKRLNRVKVDKEVQSKSVDLSIAAKLAERQDRANAKAGELEAKLVDLEARKESAEKSVTAELAKAELQDKDRQREAEKKLRSTSSKLREKEDELLKVRKTIQSLWSSFEGAKGHLEEVR